MADSLLGGVLGGEDEKPETEAPEALVGAEAFAAAIAAIASRQDPGVARRTEAFLDRQAELLKIQAEHLKDEHALRLAHLAHQSHLLLWQRLGQAIRLAFQIVIALVVIVIGAGIAVMLHDAFTSHSVVIDAFDAPAALAARGVTGTVVASDVLDELTLLQDKAIPDYLRQARTTYSNAWSNDVKVNVPETGISLGELSRLLTARFGHDLHIGGDLVETASGGLTLTVRGDSFPPKTFTGSAGGLDTLTVDAAGYVFSQFQPHAWSIYLEHSGRCPESIAFIKTVYAGSDAGFLLTWGECLLHIGAPDAVHRSLLMFREAVRFNPNLWDGYIYEQESLMQLGDEEGAWRAAQTFRQLISERRGVRSAFDPDSDYLSYVWAPLTRDLQADLNATLVRMQGNGGPGATPISDASRLHMAELQVQLHDPNPAAVMLEALQAKATSPADSAWMHFVRGLLAQENGDVAQAATEMEAFGAAVADPRIANEINNSEFNGVADDQCQVAAIEEAAGHSEEADAALRAGGHYVDCGRFRGDILDHRGDWMGAQQAYAAAIALAPDLPAGYYSWGVALARHGDLTGAIAKLQAANQRGPHWADPLKVWGDVLAKQGHFKQALAKYDKALKYAPNWAELRQARAAVTARTST